MDGDATYLLAGEADMACAGLIEEIVVPLAATLTLDLAALTFIDSSGIRALHVLSEKLGAGFGLILRNPTPNVRRLFELLGIADLPGIEVAPPSAA